MSPSAQLVPYCAVPAALTMLTHCVCIHLSLAVRILIVFVCLKLLNSCCVQLKKYLEEWSASPCCSNNLYFACDGSFPCCSSAAHARPGLSLPTIELSWSHARLCARRDQEDPMAGTLTF